MFRTNIHLKESQIEFLKNINELPLSEHVRRAIDNYMDKLKGSKASSSLSKKVGESNG